MSILYNNVKYAHCFLSVMLEEQSHVVAFSAKSDTKNFYEKLSFLFIGLYAWSKFLLAKILPSTGTWRLFLLLLFVVKKKKADLDSLFLVFGHRKFHMFFNRAKHMKFFIRGGGRESVSHRRFFGKKRHQKLLARNYRFSFKLHATYLHLAGRFPTAGTRRFFLLLLFVVKKKKADLDSLFLVFGHRKFHMFFNRAKHMKFFIRGGGPESVSRRRFFGKKRHQKLL